MIENEEASNKTVKQMRPITCLSNSPDGMGKYNWENAVSPITQSHAGYGSRGHYQHLKLKLEANCQPLQLTKHKCSVCHMRSTLNWLHHYILQQLQLPDTLQGKPHVLHVTGMGRCEVTEVWTTENRAPQYSTTGPQYTVLHTFQAMTLT